jgi:uncharacterized protein YjaG (DUF416 family)
MPNTEEYDTILSSFALDACTSIYSCICFLLDQETENIIDTAIYARDTVDMFIQENDDMELNDMLFEVKIENNYFMKLEKERQKKVILKLNQKNKISDLILDELRLIQPLSIIEINKIKF